MHSDLQTRLIEIREKRNFNVVDWVDKKANMFNDYMRKFGLKACVISVSGGVDSAVTMAIVSHAKNKEGSPIEKIVGVAQPIHSTEKIWKRAFLLEKYASIVTVDQTKIHDLLVEAVDTAIGIKGERFATGQLKSYQRTPTAYYIAQVLSGNGTPAIVMGTGNFDEDGYLCYFCKAGDGVVDVQLIADLHKNEVFTVGRHLEVPEEILQAPPSADLWEGQTDEEDIGLSYDFIELFTEYLCLDEESKSKFKDACSEEGWKDFEEKGEIAKSIHRRNSHKLNFPVNLNILPTLKD